MVRLLLFTPRVKRLRFKGAKTSDVVEQVEKGKVLGQKFYLTIVHTGNNDIWRLINLKNLEKDIISLLDKAIFISEQVILFRGGNIGSCPVFPLLLGWIYTRRSKKVGQIFKRIAEERSVLYVEKFMERKNDIFLKDLYYFYSWDLLHLNGNGYRVWFEYLIDEMKKRHIDLAKNTY